MFDPLDSTSLECSHDPSLKERCSQICMTRMHFVPAGISGLGTSWDGVISVQTPARLIRSGWAVQRDLGLCGCELLADGLGATSSEVWLQKNADLGPASAMLVYR